MSGEIVGWSHSRFGRHPELDTEGLIATVVKSALADSGIPATEVDQVWLGHFNGGFVPENFCSSLILQAEPSLRWKPVTRVENACASGSAAVYAALNAIDAGQAKVALVVGVEKMTALTTPEITKVLANASYVKEESARGLTFPGAFAELARQYFERYGDHAATLARIAAKNHENGTRNPWAHIRQDLGFEFCNTVSPSNPIIATPLRKTDCSLISDGAAALVLAHSDVAKSLEKAVRIRSRAQVNDYLPMANRNVVEFEGPRRAWKQALDQARCKIDDLSLVEVHDCFTIAELLSYEAMGLAAPGEGYRLLEEGTVRMGGALPVNPSGGLKSKGHPIGATGVSMHVLAAAQVCGEAGEMQVKDASLAAVFNMGGAAVANYVTVLERSR